MDVARKALELAEANPEFVYTAPGTNEDGEPSCVYVEEGQGSCLFGQALVALGAYPERLAEYPNTDISGVLGTEFGISLPHHRWGPLVRAQDRQDTGSAWGSEEVAGNLITFLREAE